MFSIVQLLIAVISGGIGSNIAGALMKTLSLGTLGNTVAGVLGGAAGQKMLVSTGLLDGRSILGDIAGSGIGGAILMVIVGLTRNAVVMSH